MGKHDEHRHRSKVKWAYLITAAVALLIAFNWQAIWVEAVSRSATQEELAYIAELYQLDPSRCSGRVHRWRQDESGPEVLSIANYFGESRVMQWRIDWSGGSERWEYWLPNGFLCFQFDSGPDITFGGGGSDCFAPPWLWEAENQAVRGILLDCRGSFYQPTGGDMSPMHLLANLDLGQVDFSGSQFVSQSFDGTNLEGVNLEGASFTFCDLSGAIGLKSEQLVGAEIHETKLPPSIERRAEESER